MPRPGPEKGAGVTLLGEPQGYCWPQVPEKGVVHATRGGGGLQDKSKLKDVSSPQEQQRVKQRYSLGDGQSSAELRQRVSRCWEGR